MAKLELTRRNGPDLEVETRDLEFQRISLARIDLAMRHAQESYSVLQVLGLFLVAPLLVIGKSLGRKFFMEVRLGLTELDRRTYRKKYKQRMASLIAGVLFWVVLSKTIN